MSTILKFPKEKTKRVAKLKKMEAKESAFIFSLMSLIVAALVANEALLKGGTSSYLVSDRPSVLIDQNRSLASAEGSSSSENLAWEKDLSQRLANLPPLVSARKPAQYSQNISELERFSIGVLGGKYRITLEGSEIKNIQYVQSDSSFETRERVDPSEVLKEHGGLFDKKIEQFEKVSSGAGVETWRILDSQKNEIKRIQFAFEGERLESVEVVPSKDRLPSSK